MVKKINLFKNHKTKSIYKLNTQIHKCFLFQKPSVLSNKVFDIQKIYKFSGLIKFPEMGKEF